MGDVNKAEAAWLAEMFPANKGLIWKLAKDELNSFRRQQWAGGEGPNQGCME